MRSTITSISCGSSYRTPAGRATTVQIESAIEAKSLLRGTINRWWLFKYEGNNIYNFEDQF